MAKYDDQLKRMGFLMEYKTPSTNRFKTSPVAYHTQGADGKVYGILREGTKYYIKTTTPGKEHIAESYDYIGGFNSRKENEYNSFDNATKHLEVKMINLNESYGIHKDVSTVDFKRTEKSFAVLTEEARKELDRVNQIFENSTKIGMNNTGNPESKGNASAENTTKNNEPFTEKATASLDKDLKENGTVKGATENTDVKGVDADLQSDKMKKGGTSQNDYTDAHDDLDGEGVADKKPSGGKVTHVNESTDDYQNPNYFYENDPNAFEEDYVDDDDLIDDTDNLQDTSLEDFQDDVPFEDDGNDIAGLDDTDNLSTDDLSTDDFQDDEDFDNMLQEMEDMIAGDDDTMKNYKSKGTLPVQSWDKVNENAEGVNDAAIQGDEETMKNYKAKGTLPVQSWDKLKETINNITRDVCNEMLKKNKKRVVKESIEDKIARIVAEEVNRLNVWGKHPRYRQQPMTLPDNHEVAKGTADHDWNDDSVKGDTSYGKRIGSSAPFDQKVEMLTDSVLAALKESLQKKK